MAARLALPPLIMPEVVPAKTSCTCAMAEPCASSGDRHSYQLPWWLLACRTQADILRKLMLQSKQSKGACLDEKAAKFSVSLATCSCLAPC